MLHYLKRTLKKGPLMKNVFLILLVSINISIYSMESSEDITSQEDECFLWFDGQIKAKTDAFKSLSLEDRKTYQDRLKYSEYPQEVTASLTNYAKKFYEILKQTNNQTMFDESFLASTLLKIRKTMQDNGIKKPTNITSARMFVFTNFLTKEEQQTVLEGNYIKNPHAAREAMEKCGKLFAEELVKLKLIRDTIQDKHRAAQDFTAKKN